MKPHSLHQQGEAQDHVGNKVEEDDMAEALWLSQMAATRGRAGQRKADFLEYRMMQDSPRSGQPRDREERGWSPVPRRYRPAVMQPGTGPGRMAQGHTGQEAPRIKSSAGPEALNPTTQPLDSRVKYGNGGLHQP